MQAGAGDGAAALPAAAALHAEALRLLVWPAAGGSDDLETQDVLAPEDDLETALDAAEAYAMLAPPGAGAARAEGAWEGARGGGAGGWGWEPTLQVEARAAVQGELLVALVGALLAPQGARGERDLCAPDADLCAPDAAAHEEEEEAAAGARARRAASLVRRHAGAVDPLAWVAAIPDGAPLGAAAPVLAVAARGSFGTMCESQVARALARRHAAAVGGALAAERARRTTVTQESRCDGTGRRLGLRPFVWAPPPLVLSGHAASPPPRTKWTRRVPHPVLIGHAAPLSQVWAPDGRRVLRQSAAAARGAAPAAAASQGAGERHGGKLAEWAAVTLPARDRAAPRQGIIHGGD